MKSRFKMRCNDRCSVKKILFFFVLLASVHSAGAQKTTSGEYKELQKREDSLKQHAIDILRAETPEKRVTADSIFTKMLVRALQVKNSIDYPFDSLITISKVAPADSSFRIFTWQLVITDDFVRQHGAIQMRTPDDGSLRLFPLIDLSDYMQNANDTITDNTAWYGAVYYDIISKKSGNKTIYTLLGYDENDMNTTKKLIEVLTFEDGKPVFGARDFSFNDSKAKGRQTRYIMEYKKHAGPRLAYDRDEDLIIFEHLISESGEPEKRETYVGDGDYEGFKWKEGRWVYINKVFDLVTPEGKEPVPVPLRDAKGNIDRSKLKGDIFDFEEADSIPIDRKADKKTNRKVDKKRKQN